MSIKNNSTIPILCHKLCIATVSLITLFLILGIAPVHAQPTYSWHTMFYEGHDPKAQVIDADGNIIIAGIAYSSWIGNNGESPVHGYTTQLTAYILKLDMNGNYLWHTFIGDNVTISSSLYLDLKTDALGDIYITGNIWSGSNWNGPNGELPLEAFHGGNADGYLAKINSSGQYQWHRFIGTSSVDATSALAIDSKGEIYTTTSSILLGVFSVSKFKPDGIKVWQSDYGSLSGYNSTITRGDIHIDENDNLFVIQPSRLERVFNSPNGIAPRHNLSPTNPHGFHILKLDSDGEYQWHTFFGGQFAENLTIDSASNGDLYVVGTAWGSWLENDTTPLNNFSGNADFFILKTDSKGEYQWHTFWGGQESENDPSFVLDDDDNIIVSGISIGNWLGTNSAQPLAPNMSQYNGSTSIALNPNGEYLWHTFLNGTIAASASISSSMFVTGVGRYSTNSEAPETNLLGTNIQPPLSGETMNDGIYILKYNLEESLSLESQAKYTGVEIMSNYPNPFSGKTSIDIKIDRSLHLTIIVYDILGRKVASLANGTFGAGNHALTWDSKNVAAGTYYARLESYYGNRTLKMVVHK